MSEHDSNTSLIRTQGEDAISEALSAYYLTLANPLAPQYHPGIGGEGYVYFLRAQNGFVKIGETCDLPARLIRHRRKWHGEFDFKLIWVIEHHNRQFLESDLHLHFGYRLRRKRKLGDWFALTENDLLWVMLAYPSPVITSVSEAHEN